MEMDTGRETWIQTHRSKQTHTGRQMDTDIEIYGHAHG